MIATIIKTTPTRPAKIEIDLLFISLTVDDFFGNVQLRQLKKSMRILLWIFDFVIWF